MLEIIISILTLTLMEIVLGIDNVIFISLVLKDVDEKSRRVLRMFGLAGAFVARVILLSLINHMSHLDKDVLFSLFGFDVTWHNIVMIIGGGFLIYKSVSELHENYATLDKAEDENKNSAKKVMFYIVLQIIMIDIIFSFDSILTAIGLADQVLVMIAAVIVSMIIMFFFSEFVSKMIDKFPTVKNLALCFLVLVGFVLLLDGMHYEVPKNMIYIAIGFGLLVEVINITMYGKNKSKQQQQTEADFNKFVSDYELMEPEERTNLRGKIYNWIEKEIQKAN